MEMTFAGVVDTVMDLSLDEKRDLVGLLESDLREARREEIFQNGEEARRAYENGELKFYSNVDDLMTDLDA